MLCRAVPQGVVAAVGEVMDENRTFKQLLAMLLVRREDFVFNPQQTIAAQQEAIGLRLLRNLEGSPPGAAPPMGAQQQQQQQQAQMEQAPGAVAGREQQGAPALGPLVQQQQQQLQQQSEQLADVALESGGSPGCLLPITPGMRTASPKIGAFRQQQQQQQPQAPPTVVPASPYDFPAEAQIAAAALTAKQGDTAAALLTLLDKAVEGRLERQAAAAAAGAAQQLHDPQQPAPAQQQQPQQQPQQQQQQQPQQHMYPM